MNSQGEPTAQQRVVYDELKETAADFFDSDWRHLSITPRMNLLLAACSGAGKTFLIRRLAKKLGLPLLDLEWGTWMVTGAKGTGSVHTLRQLYAFVQDNPRGIVVLDELDKMGDENASEWTRCVHVEAFSVLDRRVFPAIVERAREDGDQPRIVLTATQLEKQLATDFLIIGCGAFQSLWGKRSSVGFGSDTTSREDIPPSFKLEEFVRPELLNRFNSRILTIPPLTRTGYLELIDEAVRRLPSEYGPFVRDAAMNGVEEAVVAMKGFRFVEEVVASAVRRVRVQHRSPSPKRLFSPTTNEPAPVATG
jgi:hypothetical protein